MQIMAKFNNLMLSFHVQFSFFWKSMNNKIMYNFKDKFNMCNFCNLIPKFEFTNDILTNFITIDLSPIVTKKFHSSTNHFPEQIHDPYTQQ